MALSSPKRASICSRAFPSMFAPSKSRYSCRMLRFSESSSNRLTFSHSKTDCGTEFQGRIFKANCPFCRSGLGKKQQKRTCPVKPSNGYSGSSKNEFTRRSRCAWSSKALQKKNEMNDGAGTSNEEQSNYKTGRELNATTLLTVI